MATPTRETRRAPEPERRAAPQSLHDFAMTPTAEPEKKARKPPLRNGPYRRRT